MTKTLTITEIISSLNEAEYRLNLQRNTGSDFFREWYENIPEIDAIERESSW
jgi:hypothetical protein